MVDLYELTPGTRHRERFVRVVLGDQGRRRGARMISYQDQLLVVGDSMTKQDKLEQSMKVG